MPCGLNNNEQSWQATSWQSNPLQNLLFIGFDLRMFFHIVGGLKKRKSHNNHMRLEKLKTFTL